MNKIAAFRKAANLTQADMAKHLNKTQGAIGHYELGIRQPSIETAKQIVQVLNEHGLTCSLDDVFPVGG
ncbi:helix-turn-helix transcriptional regulator [Avibacterium paragallinarum]|uniref:Cro/CI family transcriptional regulator n=1 Tax=Avibacterium paragallinarum TaxID=728 RepID=H6U8P2_AVIPA|nr:helix-turn-helix transcriptional regulator [Avibacterium paragallinarum]AFA45140.1 Cro/CI family transcriptional regulator [Avibacterium paragallinarum]POY44949.1 XRE family transcriptional regulator [Avibacterium paragallinarum]QJE09061.1 helix-turn-helix transcriptional regulator [Avibacterium paragallinarum]QJE11257.1 helix-turn-helix transcriptional regulator [Avibacterium paragallinarum]QJE13454.1 helix-turn-helix transcriptional regulator [Avibacterium paragallinarum]